MSTLELAEEAVERLSPEEFEEFLLWLGQHAGSVLSPKPPAGRRSAQELAQLQEDKIRRGELVPFEGADLTAWPPPARKRAEEIIAEWRAQHGE